MLKSVETHSISVSWPICNESVWCVLVFSSLLNIFWLSPFCIPIVFQSGVFNVFLFHFLFYFGTALSCVYCVQSLLVPCLTASSTPVLICSSSLLWHLLSVFLFSSRVTYLYLWTLLSSAFLDWCYVSIKICLFFKKNNCVCVWVQRLKWAKTVLAFCQTVSKFSLIDASEERSDSWRACFLQPNVRLGNDWERTFTFFLSTWSYTTRVLPALDLEEDKSFIILEVLRVI